MIAEVVLDNHDESLEEPESSSKPSDKEIVSQLMEHVGMKREDAEALILILESSAVSNEEEDHKEVEGDFFHFDVDDPESDADAAEYLQDGECELCDRFIKLTKHHLIPKETWSRVQTKLLHAAEAKEKGGMEKALFVLGPGLSDVLDRLSSDRSTIRGLLSVTCDICRQCHTAVHRTHTNMELALTYNTVEKLLEDDNIRKFCQWASKQRPGKYRR